MIRFASLLLIVVAVACGSKDEDPKPDAKAKAISTLTGSKWIANSVEHAIDGDLTFQYEDFSITFSKHPAAGAEGDYTVINGGNAFPDPSGKWSLSEDGHTIFFTSGQEFAIESLTDQSLILNFTVPPSSGGRVEGMSGEFTFNLKH